MGGTIGSSVLAGDLGGCLVDLGGDAVSAEGGCVDGVLEHGVEAVCQLVQLLLGRSITLQVARLARLYHSRKLCQILDDGLI